EVPGGADGWGRGASRSAQVRNAAMPCAERLAPYSCRAVTAGADSGATAAWSRNAHDAVTGNCERNADQSMRIPQLRPRRASPAGQSRCAGEAAIVTHTRRLYNP